MKSIKLSLIAIVMLFAVIPVYGQLGQVFQVARKVMTQKKAEKKAKKENKNEDKQEVVNQQVEPEGANTSIVVSNPNDVVVLVVSADGVTKEEATKVALRSAIEQAYGTFVSANTTILNDELVKDEIVTVSSGNIAGYEEIASALLPNGRQSVTLKASVCISKLVSYAKNKGASTEFAGAAFAMNIKMKELNKKNEKIALENLLKQVEQLIPYVYDKTLEVGTPKVQQDGKYDIQMKLNIVPNENFLNMRNYIFSTIDGICLSKEECKEYSDMNMNWSMLELVLGNIEDRKDIDGFYTNSYTSYYLLRNEVPSMASIVSKLYRLFVCQCRNYKVVDNNGKVYREGTISNEDFPQNIDGNLIKGNRIDINCNDGLQSGIHCFFNKPRTWFFGVWSKNHEEFTITVSNDDIMKISEFKVEKADVKFVK